MLALLVAMSIVFSWVLSISTGFVRFNLGREVYKRQAGDHAAALRGDDQLGLCLSIGDNVLLIAGTVFGDITGEMCIRDSRNIFGYDPVSKFLSLLSPLISIVE